jgi:hypothetical protein
MAKRELRAVSPLFDVVTDSKPSSLTEEFESAKRSSGA